MTAQVFSIDGSKKEDLELPPVFATTLRTDLLHKAYVNLESHNFQTQGRYPLAGMNVVAESNNPPTGHHQARVARMHGGGGGRMGQGGGVAMVRGGRQAHPPSAEKVTYKLLNKKENKLALCSAIAATASASLVKARGHKIDKLESFPIIVSNEIESITKSKDLSKFFDALNLTQDIQRLRARLKRRSGKPMLRGRKSKIGKSVLIVVKDDKNLSKAVGTFSGVDVRTVGSLSVLDLVPGAQPIRLTVYSKNAIEEIAKIKSTHLELMAIAK